MKKLIMFLCCVIFGLQVCHAQYTTEKYTVAVADFTGNYAEEMFNACLATMPICRVTVVNWNDVAETDLADNVDFIVTGNIGEITSEPKTGKQILTGTEYTYYSCKVNFTLVMTDAKTGTVVATRTSFYTNTDQDPDKAVSDCLRFSDQDLRRLVDNGCIIKVPIPTLQEVKKTKPKQPSSMQGLTSAFAKDSISTYKWNRNSLAARFTKPSEQPRSRKCSATSLPFAKSLRVARTS